LADADWPADVVVLDFETYFDDEYKMSDDISTIEYINDDRFEATALGVKEIGRHKFRFTDVVLREEQIARRIEYLQGEYGPDLEGCTTVAHNARFDGCILARRYGIRPRYLLDTQGLANAWNAWNLTGLGALCERFGLPSKGNTKQFKELTYRRRWKIPKKRGLGRKRRMPPFQLPKPTPELERLFVEYTRDDVDREWDILRLMLPLFSRPEVELDVMNHTLGMFLEPLLHVDPEAGTEVVQLMGDEMARAVEPCGMAAEDVRKDGWHERMHAALEAAGEHADSFTKPAGNCKRGWNIACSKTDPEKNLLLNHEDEGVRQLMQAREAVGKWPLHMARARRIVNQGMANGGAIPVPVVYHGAHTGRWAGDESINLQNLPNPDRPTTHPVTGRLRSLLVAPPGHKLIIVDLAAVEARGVAWIARQNDLLDLFERNEEIYCRFAEKVLGEPEGSLRKPRPDDDPSLAKDLKFKRNSIGKVGVLGCGYGMGAAKASDTYGIERALAQDIVTTYRDSYTAITKFWSDVEAAFIYAFKYDAAVEMPHGLKFHTVREPITNERVVVATLPSSRELKYHNVSIGTNDWGAPQIRMWKPKTHETVYTWGGSLTENIVQAFCRDLLAEAVLNLHGEGIPVPLHAHDEVVCVAPEDEAPDVLARTIDIVRARPAWGLDFPLDAEGVIADCYGGH
jgi:DNA polymerase